MQTQTQSERRSARSPSKSTRGRKSTQARGRRANAITLLRDDHQKVSALLEKFEKTRSEGAKQQLAQQICMELTIHAQIEEELFYPRVQEEVKGSEDLVAEAQVEHQSLKRLIADIRNASPGDENFDACVTVLGEYVKHHVREEQNEMFPKVRKSKIDLAALGEELMQRKQELMQKQGEME